MGLWCADATQLDPDETRDSGEVRAAFTPRQGIDT